MRSGNVAEHDETNYAAAGAHCIFGKDVLMRQMIEDIKKAYVQHIKKGVWVVLAKKKT